MRRPVKTHRLWLLLLLALVLPLRTALAVGLPCPLLASGMGAPARETVSVMQAHAATGEGAACHAPGDPGKCQAGSACCGLTPLWSEMPRCPGSGPAPATRFPALVMPSPLFLAEGLERPPRSA